MDCFEDIIKTNNNFDQSLNTTISRFNQINDTNILITESPNLAANYDFKNGLTPIESWSFTQLNCLAVPLVSTRSISDGIQSVFAVQEPNTLTKWSFGDKKRRLEKHLFKNKIIGLVTFNGHKKPIQPIIVFDNGFCQSISNAIQTKAEENKQKIISEDESIQFIDGLAENKSRDNLIIYLITKSKTSTDSTIDLIYKLSLCIKTDELVTIRRQSVVNRLTNWSLCYKTATILSATHINQELIVFSLNGETETQLLKLNSSSIEAIYSLSATNAGSVCLIGKTKDNNFIIELWESKYGSLLGRMALPYEPLTNDCKIINNTVFITCFKGIVLIPIRIESISLSQIVGKNKITKSVLDSELNQQLNQICVDFESKSEQQMDEITESFTDIVQQISGNIPEDIILKLLIICSQKLRQTNGNNSESFKIFFEKLVSLPFNELFMISKLKSSKLKFQQILLILESLTQLLPSNNCSIIDWITILIDSYMNQFIMNPTEDTIKVIEQIQLRINSFCNFCEQLSQINTLFEIILSKKVNKRIGKCGDLTKPQKGQYSIEMLKF